MTGARTIRIVITTLVIAGAAAGLLFALRSVVFDLADKSNVEATEFFLLVLAVPLLLSIGANIAYELISKSLDSAERHVADIRVSNDLDIQVNHVIRNARTSVRILATNGEFVIEPIRYLLKQRPRVRVTLCLTDPRSPWIEDEGILQSLCMKSTRDTIASNLDNSLRRLTPYMRKTAPGNEPAALTKALPLDVYLHQMVPTVTMIMVDDRYLRLTPAFAYRTRLSFEHADFLSNPDLAEFEGVFSEYCRNAIPAADYVRNELLPSMTAGEPTIESKSSAPDFSKNWPARLTASIWRGLGARR